ncbi:MAG: ferredoxin [Spirochaetia bacterium]|nr:ferredoxin [Spirochaetia bacterium]
MSKIVTVDKDDCTSCSLCADTLPQYFRMDDDDIAETHNDGENLNAAVVSDEDTDQIQESIDDCPGECIRWKE